MKTPLPKKLPLLDAPVLRLEGTNHVRLGRRRFIHFAGCDYLRLSRHPAVIAAFRETAENEGLGMAASRSTTGNHRLYHRLEAALARFAAVETALLVGAGYLADLAVAQALAGEVDCVLLDEAAHPALHDAAGMLGVDALKFRHRDPVDLQRAFGRVGTVRRPLVLTDGLFPLSGEIAPLADYLRALPPDGLLLVDDAHGLGVLGKQGRGSPEECGVGADPRLLRTATLSKALGSFGGVILGPAWLVRKVAERSRLYRGSTPFPLPCAAAALESLRVLRAEPDRMARLRRNLRQAKTAFAEIGFPQPDNDAPVLSICPPDESAARKLETRLAQAGIHARAIAYPGDAAGWRFRFALSSEHKPAQIERLVAAVAGW